MKSIYRGVSIYFLLDFLWITLYLLSSFFDYVGSEYDEVKTTIEFLGVVKGVNHITR